MIETSAWEGGRSNRYGETKSQLYFHQVSVGSVSCYTNNLGLCKIKNNQGLDN